MKDIKTLMIGFLLATCMFLLMGQGSSKGKYQGFASNKKGGGYVVWLIDTTTGQTFVRYTHDANTPSEDYYWKENVSPKFKYFNQK